MALVTVRQAQLAFGHVALLDHVDLAVERGERVALIGRNGSGKSSLLRAMAGERALDDGEILHQPGATLALVSQEPQFGAGDSVFEAVAEGLGDVHRQLAEHRALAARIAEAPSAADLERLQALQTILEHNDGWRAKSRVDATIERLGLTADARCDALSGGTRKRVALARALVMEPDLLLLDEPTNHLDLATIEWLENLLAERSGSLLFVTHDRRFLDRVATRIVELDRGQLASFPGSFAHYLRRKEESLAAEAQQSRKFDKLLKQEEAWIRKGIEARRTRNEGRVRRLEQLRRSRAERRARVGHVNFTLDDGARSGRMVAELHHVSHGFGGPPLIRDFSCRILRGDKVGIVGPNGCGKTTLLRLLLGGLEPDSGSVRRGSRLDIAYFDQMREQLDEEATLVDAISQGADFIEVGGGRKHVISYLGDFLFPPERARARVSALSGGERNRLLLARLFSRPANLLVLDEPTNDLDMETLELLEALLQDFTGTLFLVSHDRAFLDNVVTQVIAFEGNGVLREYAGGYADWQRARTAAEMPSGKVKKTGKPQAAPEPRPARRERLSYNETRELAALPAKIEALEREQAQISERLADGALYRDQPEEVRQLQQRFAAIEAELMQSLTRWEALDSRAAATGQV
jgi:ATP-binding cassette subfamily F protein uup